MCQSLGVEEFKGSASGSMVPGCRVSRAGGCAQQGRVIACFLSLTWATKLLQLPAGLFEPPPQKIGPPPQ